MMSVDLNIITDNNLKKWVAFMYLILGRVDGNDDIYKLFSILTDISEKDAIELHEKAIDSGYIAKYNNIGEA